MKWKLTLGSLLMAFSVLAQIKFVDTTYVLDELVISANKVPEMRSRISQQVQILSVTQISNLQVQSTADLLSNSGTVAIQKSQQGGGSPQIGGFEASRVVLVVDGVRMNNLIYRAGHYKISSRLIIIHLSVWNTFRSILYCIWF